MWLGIIMFTPLCTLKMLISLITVGVYSMMVVLILTLCFTVHYYQYNFTGTNYHIQHYNHWTEFATFVSYYLDHFITYFPSLLSCYICHFNIIGVHNEFQIPTQICKNMCVLNYDCYHTTVSNNGLENIHVCQLHALWISTWKIMLYFKEDEVLLLIRWLCLTGMVALNFPMMVLKERGTLLILCGRE